MRATLLLMTALFFFSFVAKADILFLDFNGSAGEVAAAKKAAAKRGEKLIVLPQISNEEKKALEKNRNEWKKVQTEVAKTCTGGTSAQCTQVVEKSIKIDEDYLKLVAKKAVNSKSLPKELEKLKIQNTKITSLVISGHDGNGYFSGTFGGINESDLSELSKQHSEVFSNIRSLLLWGCYTTNINSVNYKWKKILPHADIIAGFDGKAPLGIRAGSATYLEDILTQEKELTQIQDKKRLQKYFTKFRNIREMNAALCAGSNYVTNQEAMNLDEIYGMCKNVDVANIKKIYYCYKNAETPACQNPPSNTANSDLRNIYNQLQTYQHCFVENNDIELPTPETTIRLIFFDTVKKNIVSHYKEDLSFLDGLLETLHAPQDIRFADLDTLPRGEILSRLNKAKDFLARAKGTDHNDFVKAFNNPYTPEIEIAMNAVANTQSLIGELNNTMVPFDWVEPNATAQANYPFNVNVNQLNQRRHSFEQSRAYNRASLEIASLIKEDEEFPSYKESLKVLKAVNENVRALTNQVAELEKNQAQDGSNSKQLEELKKQLNQEQNNNTIVYQKSIDLINKLKIKNFDKLKSRMQNWKNEDYPVPEGQEIFNQAIETMNLQAVYPFFANEKDLE